VFNIVSTKTRMIEYNVASTKFIFLTTSNNLNVNIMYLGKP
jgi:hypothetical protein